MKIKGENFCFFKTTFFNFGCKSIPTIPLVNGYRDSLCEVAHILDERPVFCPNPFDVELLKNGYRQKPSHHRGTI